MDWAEHQRIVFAARGLLPVGDIPFTVKPNKAGREAFARLQSAYQETGSRSVLKVSKGIHQPTVNPHLQLRLETTFGKGAEAQTAVNVFHLDVSAVDTPEMEDRFQWKGVQFSCVVGKNTYAWPENATSIIVKRERRNSVSSVDLNAHILAVAEAESLAKAEAEAKLLAERLEAFAKQHGIDGRNLNNFKKGRSVPGTDGAYQYGKPKPGDIGFQRRGTRGYVLV